MGEPPEAWQCKQLIWETLVLLRFASLSPSLSSGEAADSVALMVDLLFFFSFDPV